MLAPILKKHWEAGKTALAHAVEKKNSLGVLQILIESGADINAKAIDGLTPLQIAKNRDVWGKVYQALQELHAK